MSENWRQVIDAPLYEVSNHGRLRSWVLKGQYFGPRRRRSEPVELKRHVDKDGYEYVFLHGKVRKIHRLVLEAFVGPCPPGMEGCHNDGNPANNRLDNLRWDTKRSNGRDRVDHGTHFDSSGENNPRSKLKADDVVAIRRLASAENLSLTEIAGQYGVSVSAISRIVLRKSWSKVA